MSRRAGFFDSIGRFFADGLGALWSRPNTIVPGLDVLRSLAVLMVVSGHYFGDFSTLTSTNLSIGKFPVLHFGWAGVDLFFVLSGYLIGRQLWQELNRRKTIDVPVFLARRGLRIWPYYFAFIAWAMMTSGEPLSRYLPDLFFYSNYTDNGISGGWSLSTEEQFYIFVPLVLLAATRFCAIERQWIIWFVLLLLLPVFRFLALKGFDGQVVDPLPVHLIYTPFHTHSDGLVAGLIIAWLSVMRPAFLNPVSFSRNLVVPLCLIVAGVGLRLVDKFLFAYSGLALIFGGFVIFVIRDRTYLSKLADNRTFYVLSRLSYAMYLNHFVILDWAMPAIVGWLKHNQMSTNLSGFTIGYVAILTTSMAVATLTFVVIETPFLRLRDRWMANRRQAKLGPAVAQS